MAPLSARMQASSDAVRSIFISVRSEMPSAESRLSNTGFAQAAEFLQ